MFSNVLLDTPTKRVKPNEDSTLDHSKVGKAMKTSFLDKLKSGDLTSRKPKVATQTFEISQFELPFEYKASTSSNNSQEMIDQAVHNEKEKKIFQLNRKMTCMEQQKNERQDVLSLSLYRSNSTFDQGRTTQDVRLGDNIYLRQINSQCSQPPIKSSMQNEDHGSRIEQDYEIQQNLKQHDRHHENYICLNKLERIFYYVKKIHIGWEDNDSLNFIQKLASQQIKLYNRDQKGLLIRFHQSWLQHHSLYLTFEVGAHSLEETSRAHSRLRQVQAWDLLRDAAQTLQWMSQSIGVPHLNIKPGNILKFQKRFKLADPYIDPMILQAYLRKQSSAWSGWAYLAPEIKNFFELIEGLDLCKSDIYSLGMCLIENMLGDRYFPREGKAFRIHIQKHLHGYSPALIKTLQRMVSMDPSKRPTASQLCEIGKKDQEETGKIRRRVSI